jgi:soluble lytic murein transglycosylase-like protein
VLTIKRFVDGYAARADSLSAAPWEEGLRSIFGRASQYAPVIAKAFRDHGVPPLVGLYIPMVESEYRACIDSPSGAVGLFQIMPETMRIYRLDPKDRCKVEKAAPVAAQYVADRITEFGSDARV